MWILEIATFMQQDLKIASLLTVISKIATFNLVTFQNAILISRRGMRATG